MDIKEFDIKSLHKIQYDILVEFDRICKNKGLKYYLTFGTLLGSIRHKGFIPWDDDVDVMMPLKDYNMLLSLNPFTEPYFLQNTKTDPEFNHVFTKIRNSNTTLINREDEDRDINHGVCIDIYPIIGCSDKKSERRNQFLWTKIYYLCHLDRTAYNHGIIMKMLSTIFVKATPRFIKRRLELYALYKVTQKKHNSKKFYILTGNVDGLKNIYKHKIFQEAIEMPFEDTKLLVPCGYNEFLKINYGNYMELPPSEEQGNKLNVFVKFDSERPYTDYKGVLYCNKRISKK